MFVCTLCVVEVHLGHGHARRAVLQELALSFHVYVGCVDLIRSPPFDGETLNPGSHLVGPSLPFLSFYINGSLYFVVVPACSLVQACVEARSLKSLRSLPRLLSASFLPLLAVSP